MNKHGNIIVIILTVALFSWAQAASAAGTIKTKARSVLPDWDEDTSTCTIHFRYCDETTSTVVEHALRDLDSCIQWAQDQNNNRDLCDDELWHMTIWEFRKHIVDHLEDEDPIASVGLFCKLTLGDPHFRLCLVKPPKPPETPPKE